METLDKSYLQTSDKVFYYLDDIEKIASYPIWKKLTVKGVGLSSKTIQRAYKEIKKYEFKGDIIDYLCYVSLLYSFSQFFINNKFSIPIEDNMFMLESFLNFQVPYKVLDCRLFLKDEVYFDNMFKQFGVEDKKIYDMLKDFIIKETNNLMKVHPKNPTLIYPVRNF